MKNLKTFEEMTYGMAVRLSNIDNKIKNYIEEVYPEHGYSSHLYFGFGTFQGRQIPPYNYSKKYITYGKGIGVGQIKKIIALAKRKNDSKLFSLIDDRQNINNPERVEADKYNL